ncbi:hypothetical protein HU200_022781 [Digitaria exilis]|uniref:Acidic protein n=1 Tax=Digitaria exilis TaxID=1010633 RepID=A0A835C184_9POAL|nr:hypothetical protein HU200_022781 [Digitaria exilis]
MEAAGKGLKSFIAVVLVLGLILGQQQIQVEAKICCPSMRGRDTYNYCLDGHYGEAFCAKIAGCKIDDGKCDYPAYSSDSALIEDDATNALEFCKLGCASSSSLCDNNIKPAVGNEETSDAVNRCDEACYRFCTKHVHTAAATTAAS